MVENTPGVSATRPAKPVVVFDIEHTGQQSVTAVVQAVCAVANTCQLPGFDPQRLDIQTPVLRKNFGRADRAHAGAREYS